MSWSKNPLPLIFALVPVLSWGVIENGYNPGQEIPQGVLSPAFTAPGRVNVEGYWDFTVQASFLYWQPKEGGLNFAYVVPNNPGVNRGERINKHFSYHPGFQIGVETDLHHDGWEAAANYTYLHSQEHTSSGIPSWAQGMEATWMSPINGPATSSVTQANAKWTFKYDMIDLAMMRPSYVGRSFILSPLFGFRGGWIRQKYRVNYSISPISTLVPVLSYQHSVYLGPRIGLGSKVLIGMGFYLNGNSYLSLLYQDMRVKLKRNSFTTAGTVLTNVKNKQRFFSPNLDLTLGLGWGSYYYKNKFFFDANINFDALYYWDQNWMRELKDTTDVRSGGNAGDLSLQGLTANLGFYF